MSKANIKDVHVSVDPDAPIPAELLAQVQTLNQRVERDIDYSDIPPTPHGVVWIKPGHKLPGTR
jgi:hypothetical protein